MRFPTAPEVSGETTILCNGPVEKSLQLTSAKEGKDYYHSKEFVAQIRQAINCMDTTKDLRQKVMWYFEEEGDPYFARRNLGVIDLIQTSITIPFEVFGISDRDALQPWAFALQLLTVIQRNIIKDVVERGKQPKSPHRWLDTLDIPVANRMCGFADELMADVLPIRISGRSDKIQHETVVEYLWFQAALHRFTGYNMSLQLPHFRALIFSIWEAGKCTLAKLYWFMDIIYGLRAAPVVPGLEKEMFDTRHRGWLGQVFGEEWRDQIEAHTLVLLDRLSAASDCETILENLRALHRFLPVLQSTQAERLIMYKRVFAIASNACIRGMKEAGYIEHNGERLSRTFSRLLEDIFTDCLQHALNRESLVAMEKKLRDQMPNHPDFDLYKN